MRILIFAGYFYPHKGGAEDYIDRLAKGLIKKGYQIDILTSNTEHTLEFEKKDGINIYRFDCWNFLNNKYPVPRLTIKNLKIIKKILKNKYDFVNTHTRFWITSGIGLIFSKIKKIPLIHVEHGTVHTEIDNKFVSMVNKIIDHTLGSLVIKNAKVRIGVSNAALEFMEHLGKKGDIKISKGLDLNKFKKRKSILRNKLKIKDNKIIIISTGRLIYAKGFQDLITAFSRLDNKNLRLIIVGNGDYKKELEKLTSNSKNNIFILGEKNQDEIIELLSLSDIFVNPSYSEGMPTTILEAGAIGLPVIATDVGGTREIIKNKKTGLLIDKQSPNQIKEAIDYLINNKKKTKAFVKNLNTIVKKDYNYNNMINKFDDMYNTIK